MCSCYNFTVRQSDPDIFSFTKLLEKQETLPNSYLKENSASPLPPILHYLLSLAQNSKVILEILGVSGQLEIGIGFN